MSVTLAKHYVTETYDVAGAEGKPNVVFSGTYRDCRYYLIGASKLERDRGYPIGIQTGDYASVNIGKSATLKIAITDKYPHPTN